MDKKDYWLGLLAGLLIGLFFLPFLGITKPALYEKYYIFVVPFFLIGAPLGLWVAKFISWKISVVWQVGKFGVIGVLNTLIDWGVLSLLLASLGGSLYAVYKGISFIVANINSYYWNKYWTFSGGVNQKTRGEFIQFFIVSAVGFFINVGIATYVFKSVSPVGGLNFNQWGILGAAIGSVAGLAWNFLGYKFFVFKK